MINYIKCIGHELHFKMMCYGVWLIFSLLVIYCHDTANGSEKETALKLEKNQNMFLSKIKIGSTKDSRLYSMILGTDFSGLWLFSKTACNGIKKKNDPTSWSMCNSYAKLYDDTKVYKEEHVKRAFTLPHLQGTVSGYIIKETITVGEHVLTNQDVGIVTTWDNSIAQNNRKGYFDGYFGIMIMNEDEANRAVGSSFFQTLFDNNELSKKLFGIYLNDARSEGELRLGGINSNHIAGSGGEKSLKDVPLESGGTKGWIINIDSFKIGSTEVDTNLKVLVDPSTNFFQGKKKIISKINKLLGTSDPEYDTFFFDKPLGSNPPVIKLTINNEVYTLDSDVYSEELTSFHIKKFTSRFGYHDAIQDNAIYDLIFGSTFLNKYYSVFDMENKKISFAEAGNSNKH